MSEQTQFTTKNILERTDNFSPSIGIILGSGLDGLIQEIAVEFTIPYNQIPNFPESTAPGHKGKLILGMLGGKKIIAMQGRFHHYEGYSMEEITFPVRLIHALGAKTLFVTNAAGGMNPGFEIGELMIITDHINLFPVNPLTGKNDDKLGPRFVDMGEAYRKDYIALAQAIAAENNIKISEGVYAGLTGPCFETPAEYRYLWRIGADAVGMSTVPEVIAAKHAGMDVFGLSIITDLGIEGRVQAVTYEEVLRVARLREPEMTMIVKELAARIICK